MLYVKKVALILAVSIFCLYAYLVYQNRLVTVPPRDAFLNNEIKIKAKVAPHLTQLILDAQKDGMCLVVMSGYRDTEEQEYLFATSKSNLVAEPGKSQHQLGTAVDFGGCPLQNGVRDDSAQRPDLKNTFERLPEYAWLAQNAGKYGFVQTYKTNNKNVTGFPAESWHWNYIHFF